MIARRPYPRTLLATLATVAMTVSGAALSWACTPESEIAAHGANGNAYGPAGSEVTARGERFPANTPVQLRWTNARGETVATIPTQRGSEFTVVTTAPRVADGTYYITANAVDEAGKEWEAPTSFYVGDPPASSSPSPDPAPAPVAPNPGSNAPNPGGTTPANPGATTPGPRGTSPIPGSGSPIASPNPDGGTTPGPKAGIPDGEGRAGDEGTRSGRAGTGRSDGGAAPAGGGATTLPSGQAVFSDSLPAHGPNAEAAGPSPAIASNGGAASQGSAGGDLWSGFSSDETDADSFGAPVGPSDEPGSPLTWGMAFVALGLVGLVGGFGVAEVRRRRRSFAR